jgi:hypothetical protein
VPHSRAPHGVHCTGVTGGSGTVVVVADVLVLVEAALVDEPDRATVLVGPPARPPAGAHALKQAAESTMTMAPRGA